MNTNVHFKMFTILKYTSLTLCVVIVSHYIKYSMFFLTSCLIFKMFTSRIIQKNVTLIIVLCIIKV